MKNAYLKIAYLDRSDHAAKSTENPNFFRFARNRAQNNKKTTKVETLVVYLSHF